jgi:hypothetical protein
MTEHTTAGSTTTGRKTGDDVILDTNSSGDSDDAVHTREERLEADPALEPDLAHERDAAYAAEAGKKDVSAEDRTAAEKQAEKAERDAEKAEKQAEKAERQAEKPA